MRDDYGSRRQAICVSQESEKASRNRPGRKQLCSSSLGWDSLLIQTYDQPAFVERYETPASPDFLIVVVANGEYTIESLSSGVWNKAKYHPGTVGITAPHTVNLLRWHSQTGADSRVIRTYVPEAFFLEAAEEFRRAGTRAGGLCTDALALNDPAIEWVIRSLSKAASAGMPGIYAESAARFLATHLVARAHGLSDPDADWANSTELTDRRLKRVREFMEWNLASPISIDELASEAGLSRFHFSRVFRSKLGLTPHQFLLRARMKHAAKLLKTTDLSIAQIVSACGYTHAGHFAAAFAKLTGKTPAAYRRDI